MKSQSEKTIFRQTGARRQPVMTLRILYDGWPLATQPNSPATLHLQTLLAYLPPEIEAHVALPAAPSEPLPIGVTAHLHATNPTEAGRLNWEQRILPKISHLNQANLVHLVGGRPALIAGANQLLTPTSQLFSGRPSRSPANRQSFSSRMGDALGQGGQARLQGLFWPEDLPAPESNYPLLRLPRLIHPAFLPAARSTDPALLAGLDLPESYLLYHGPLEPFDVRCLLNAWSWAAPAIGEYYPLAIAGVDHSLKSTLLPVIRDARCESTVHLLPPISVASLAALYRGCSALIHPTIDSPWEGAISLAMACHKPLVALATPWSDALVGPAGYLVAAGEDQSTSRLLGAALITVIVEENVAESLAEQAAQRTAAWSSGEQTGRYTRHLAEAYSSLVAQQAGRH